MRTLRISMVCLLSLVVTVSVGLAQAGVRQGTNTSGQMQQQQQTQQQMQQQMTQQQLQVHQQRLALMTQTRERVQALDQRAETLARNLRQAGAQLGPRGQTMQQLCDGLRDTTHEMRRSMDRLHAAVERADLAAGDLDRDRDRDQVLDGDRDRDRLMDRDPDQDWDRDMDRLRQHIADMAGPMEDALKVMEQLHDRIHQE